MTVWKQWTPEPRGSNCLHAAFADCLEQNENGCIQQLLDWAKSVPAELSSVDDGNTPLHVAAVNTPPAAVHHIEDIIKICPEALAARNGCEESPYQYYTYKRDVAGTVNKNERQSVPDLLNHVCGVTCGAVKGIIYTGGIGML